jgi:lipoprotein-anchoring transpeptidase ErfK/SrfK
MIRIIVGEQKLQVLRGADVVAEFPVSTAANGIGIEKDSFKTPPGLFRVCQKIGDGVGSGAIFKSRQLTGEIGTEEMEGDLVQTRILWLDGLEPFNTNTKDRFIYIHGTNKESQIGSPTSAGCIRMRNEDVMSLYEMVVEGSLVHIDSGEPPNPVA